MTWTIICFRDVTKARASKESNLSAIAILVFWSSDMRFPFSDRLKRLTLSLKLVSSESASTHLRMSVYDLSPRLEIIIVSTLIFFRSFLFQAASFLQASTSPLRVLPPFPEFATTTVSSVASAVILTCSIFSWQYSPFLFSSSSFHTASFSVSLFFCFRPPPGLCPTPNGCLLS